MEGLAPRIALALAALALPWAVAAALARPGAALLERAGRTAINYQGRSVPQGAGFVLPLAFLSGTAVLMLGGAVRPAEAWSTLAGTFALGLAGAIDDHAGEREPKGWLGHGRALRAGRLTAGGYKALSGLALAGLAGAARGPAAMAALALGPNAVNTLDVRPGRAALGILVATLGLAWAAGPQAAVPLLPLIGACAGIWPAERGHWLMWGDTGANAAGFALASAWAAAPPGVAASFAAAAAALVIVGDHVHLGTLIGAPRPLRSAGTRRNGG